MNQKHRAYIAKLHEARAPAMRQMAERHLADKSLADDLVQKVFLTACRRAEVFCEHPEPEKWLTVVLQKKIMHERRRAGRSLEVLTDQIELFGSEMELPLEACLPREMDEKYREILVLRFEELLDYREIAERLHISAALCRQRVSRAKAYYRKWLKGRK